MRVGINLLTCNRRPEHLTATMVAVETLLESDAMASDPVLAAVDNGSQGGTVDYLMARGFRVRALSENVGIAAGRNRVYDLLGWPTLDVVVEIHNDMIFPSVWLTPLLAALRETTQLGLACASLITQNGVLGSPRVPISYDWPRPRILETVERGVEAARRPGVRRPGLQHPVAKRVEMLAQIGLYDERFSGSNFEDTDEVRRALAGGWLYEVIGEAVVWHHYLFSRLQVGPEHNSAFRENRGRFLAKWPDAAAFLRTYNTQTEALYDHRPDPEVGADVGAKRVPRRPPVERPGWRRNRG